MKPKFIVLLLALAALPAAGLEAQAPPAEQPPSPSAASPGPRFHIAGFGALDFRDSITTGASGLEASELDLYFTSQLSDRWSALGEVFLQHTRESPDDDATLSKHTELDIERLYIAYSRSDLLRLEAGQVHTGLVRWNEREHRGRFLQSSIDTPAMARREEQRGAWPLHFVGFWNSGRLPGSLGLTWGGGAGAGRGRRRDEIATLGEGAPAVVGQLGLAPDRVPGLELGVAAYRGKIPDTRGEMNETDLTLSGSYTSGRLESRAEWGRMHHTPKGGRSEETRGWYELLSYRLGGRLQKFRPYLLLDHLSVPEEEAYLSQVPELEATAAGVRWDAARHLTVKLDHRWQHVGDTPSEQLFRLQLAFYF